MPSTKTTQTKERAAVGTGSIVTVSKRTAADARYTPRKIAARTAIESPASLNGGLTDRVKNAIDLMIETGSQRAECAVMAGLTDGSLLKALRKEVVRKYFDEALLVYRESLRPRAVHKISGLMDSAENEKTQLEAAKYLDGMGKQSGIQINLGVQTNISPGYMVDVTSRGNGAAEILQRAGSIKKVDD